MSTFKKQGANKVNTKIDTYFRRLEKTSPVKRKAVHDENSPPSPVSSPKKRQFGDLKANNTKLKQHSIRLPLRDMNPQRKLSSAFPRPTTKPSFTILTDDAIKKGITSTVVKNKAEVKNTEETSKVEKNQEASKEETPKEESEDSDDDLFTKTTNSSVKFMPLDLSSSISDFENSSPTDDFFSDQEEPVLFVDPDLEFSLSEISSLPKSKQKIAPQEKNYEPKHTSEEIPKKDKKVPKKQATLEDMILPKDAQKQEETQEIEADEGKTLPSLEPESVSQIMIPYANPRGKDLVEKLDINNSNKVTEDKEEGEEDNDH